jgi:hypothetical protein
MQNDLRTLILERVRQELTVVSQKCLRAVEAIDHDSGSTVCEALSHLEELTAEREKAMSRLLVLRDAERDFHRTPGLPTCDFLVPASLARHATKRENRQGKPAILTNSAFTPSALLPHVKTS